MQNKKLIVISAVNIVEGGGLTILKQCLAYAETFVRNNPNYYVKVLLHTKKLYCTSVPGIEVMEFKAIKNSWFKRIKFEYYDCLKLSAEWKPSLWLAMHDMTPCVKAEKRVVYCHNSSPFRKITFRDLRFDYKVFLFTCFYKLLYRINIRKNDYVIVQQQWLKEEFVKSFGVKKNKVIVSYPQKNETQTASNPRNSEEQCVFFYPSYPRLFKNFEIICEAAAILNRRGIKNYSIKLTLDGSENKYASWIYSKYHQIDTIEFVGLLPFDKVQEMYTTIDCLLFPSTLESWGLPISEFVPFHKPILTADLAYAYETAAGSKRTCFFNPYESLQLAEEMERIIRKDYSHLKPVPIKKPEPPVASGWTELFRIILP